MGEGSDLSRRKLMEIGIYAIGVSIASVSGFAFARFTIGPSFRPQRSRWIEVELGDTQYERAGFTRVVVQYEKRDGWLTANARKLAYVKRTKENQIVAISAGCSHLGCIVTWDEAQKIFKCPCHDGRFDADGKVISGPPPAPLKRHKTKIENGKIFLATEPVPFGGDAGDNV